ncbi:MAG: outer membrane protein assembly factor [Rhizobiaceae bacterium]|nr:outer membrane protein assembly factor [Rhizobiaceae bacterium]
MSFSGGDDDLKKALEDASALVQDEKDPVNGDLGLVIKARDDRERLLGALYENARYGAVVNITVGGTPIDELPPVPEFPRDKPVPVTVDVVPGPVFTIGSVSLTGDATKFDPAAYGLDIGAQANSTLVISAAGKIVQDLEAEGRPLARLTERGLTADHKSNTVDIRIGAEGGPVADVGDVTVSGTKTVDPEFVEKWSRLDRNKRYSPEEIKEANERLRKLGVFSSINIVKADRLDAEGRIPLAIEVSDGKQRYFGLGAQFSSLDGFGLLGYWGHRNLFGGAESLKITGSVSRLGEQWNYKELDYLASIEFSKPGIFDPYSTLNVSVIAQQVNPDTYRSTSFTKLANIAYELSKRDTLTGGFDLTWNETEDFRGVSQFLTFSLPVTWTRDASDDKLDPHEGYRLRLTGIPSYEIYRSNFFHTIDGQVSAYTSFGEDDRVTLAGKLAMGTLLMAPALEDVPATRRFYLGGGGTVRGYAYQEITPRNSDGDPLGGRSYMLASFETRVKVTETVGIVPFIDVGTVSSRAYPDFSDIRAGAGIGLRYATPFGPLRLDVAMPINRYQDGSRFGIYAGIGQSF